MSLCILTAIFIAVTYLFGLLYTAISKANRRCLIAAVGWTGFCIFGAIGVPFHETAHLITAVIFNHSITDFSLFRPIKGKKDGKLGYVYHTYNKRSLYQCVGNFFIGTAPMIFGAGLLMFLLYGAVPEISADFKSIMLDFWKALGCLDSYAILTVFAAVFICPHIGMSGADFKNTGSGVLALLAVSIIVPYFIHDQTDISYAVMIAVYYDFIIRYVYLLAVGLIIGLISLGVGKILTMRIDAKSKTEG